MKMDTYLVDTLMADLGRHDRQPSAFLVYLYLYRWTKATGNNSLTISLREIAESTGLSKRSVQSAIARLHKRKLIGIRRESITAIPTYRVLTPWKRR